MIADYDIALARLADAAGIAALSRDAIERGLTWSWTPERVLRSMRDPETNVIVARNARAMVGFAIMKYRDEEAHLLLMAVHPLRRRLRVGSTMLEWLEVTARAAGASAIRVEARDINVIARAFYAKQGYRLLKHLSGYYEGRGDAVVLSKSLRASWHV